MRESKANIVFCYYNEKLYFCALLYLIIKINDI